MVNIKSFIQFYFSNTAPLAGMIISLSSPASLSLPILTIPMVSAKVTFPSRIINTYLPLGLPLALTLPRTKAMVRSLMPFGVANPTAIFAGKIKFRVIVGSIYATPINRLPFVATLIRAIRMLTTLDLRSLTDKCLTTYFAYHIRSIA